MVDPIVTPIIIATATVGVGVTTAAVICVGSVAAVGSLVHVVRKDRKKKRQQQLQQQMVKHSTITFPATVC